MVTRTSPPAPGIAAAPAALARGAVATFLLAIGLAGCTTGFLYNRVDWMVSWYVNGLVSLDDSQEERLRTSVRQTLAWHRETQIPKYLALLEDVSRQSQQTVTPAMLEERYQEMRTLMDATIERVVTDAAPLLKTLSPAQLAELKASLEKDNEELWEEYAGATPETRQKRRSKNALQMLRRFVGRLSTEQHDLVELRVASMHDNASSWIERRREWQGRFFSLLRDGTPGPEFEATLRDMALHPDQFDAPAYREETDDNRRIITVMLADVLNGLSARQRDHLVRKLAEYSDDLREIARSG